MSWHHDACHRELPGDPDDVAAILHRLREGLADEVAALPGQSKLYGRPHAHPRARHEPRFSKTGERIPGAVLVRPDCPSPVKGRCECREDGSWRPSVGVTRADSTATHGRLAPADLLPGGLERAWVDEVYELGPDGLWRCRWPVRRALERIRGASVHRWAIAIRLIRGDALATVWGSHGTPPDPEREARSILGSAERFAREERESEFERRPGQWWVARRQNSRSRSPSESQSIAEHGSNVTATLQSPRDAATIPPTGGSLRPFPPVEPLRTRLARTAVRQARRRAS